MKAGDQIRLKGRLLLPRFNGDKDPQPIPSAKVYTVVDGKDYPPVDASAKTIRLDVAKEHAKSFDRVGEVEEEPNPPPEPGTGPAEEWVTDWQMQQPAGRGRKAAEAAHATAATPVEGTAPKHATRTRKG